MSEKYAAGITNEELGSIYLRDYVTMTIMGDKFADSGDEDQARQMWLEAIAKLDLGYKALDIEPPNTLLFFNSLKEVGIF